MINRTFWKTPMIIVPAAAAIVAAVLGAVLPIMLLGGEERAAKVTQIRPTPLVAGEQVDIQGKNLNLVSEVLLIRGFETFRIATIHVGDELLILRVPLQVKEQDYSLLFRTNDGKEVGTERTVNVVSGSMCQCQP